MGQMMPRSPVEQRLESWRAVVRTGQPDWLADLAPKIVRELEDECRLTHPGRFEGEFV